MPVGPARATTPHEATMTSGTPSGKEGEKWREPGGEIGGNDETDEGGEAGWEEAGKKGGNGCLSARAGR